MRIHHYSGIHDKPVSRRKQGKDRGGEVPNNVTLVQNAG